jgi:hypothetical protein
MWLGLGLRGEVGRDDKLIYESPVPRALLMGWDYSTAVSAEEFLLRLPPGALSAAATGTSIFDPVLCEIAYRWFCPPAGRVLDPFAGGPVRGVVAAVLGRSYTGVDLRPEQIDANEANWREIYHPEGAEAAPLEGLAEELAPRWIAGDSMRLDELLGPPEPFYDLIFTCPPYGDLERYSDDPADLSTMGYEAFSTAHQAIIAAAVARLHEHRFACVVVGDFRDQRTGALRGFVLDTVRAFEEAGARLYNDGVLVTAVGSLPVRTSRQFPISRKLGRSHQCVLVFVKGGWREAAEACGPVEVSLPASMTDTEGATPDT